MTVLNHNRFTTLFCPCNNSTGKVIGCEVSVLNSYILDGCIGQCTKQACTLLIVYSQILDRESLTVECTCKVISIAIATANRRPCQTFQVDVVGQNNCFTNKANALFSYLLAESSQLLGSANYPFVSSILGQQLFCPSNGINSLTVFLRSNTYITFCHKISSLAFTNIVGRVEHVELTTLHNDGCTGIILQVQSPVVTLIFSTSESTTADNSNCFLTISFHYFQSSCVLTTLNIQFTIHSIKQSSFSSNLTFTLNSQFGTLFNLDSNF